MTAPSADQTVVERLVRLLDQGLLPAGGPAEAAERLLERLRRPARIALLGLPGSGKSSILNLLAGTIVVPETLRLPTIVVQHALDDRMLCTLADGRTEAIPGSDLSQVLTRNPALVTVERDLPALKVISLLEVSAGPMDAEQRRAAIWASKRADIVIWCTTSYLPKEQVVWESMPDVVKDNGFLFLTKTDLLGNAEATAGMLQRIEQRAGEEFRQVFAISARAARAAMPPGGPVDRDSFRESGAAAVISTIKSRVQAARRADTDTAEFLLARHVEAGSLVAQRFAVPDTAAPLVAPVAGVPEPGWTPPPDPVLQAPVPPRAPSRPAAPEPAPAAANEDDMMAKILAGVGGVAKPPPPMPVVQPAAPEPLAEAPVVAAPTDPQPDLRQNNPLDPAALASPGGRRLSDRLRQTPEPEEIAAAASMPLRITWKSRGETAASAAALPAANARIRPGQPPAQPVARKEVEPPAAEPPRDEPQTVQPIAAEAKPEVLAPAPTAAPTAAPTPTAVTEATDRGSRVSMFGAKKPVADTSAADSKPAARTARPMEPVTRVRGPAPSVRAAAPAIAPEELASPRISSLRDRQAEASGSERRERPHISARLAETPAAPVAPVVIAGSDLTLLDDAIALIIARSTDLAARIDPAEKLAVDIILDHGRRTIESVNDLLVRGTSPGLRRISTGLGDVLDLIMLMQLEKGHAPADDTLTLILQIRRDLEALRAA